MNDNKKSNNENMSAHQIIDSALKFIPIIIFFATYKIYDLITATAVFVVLTVIALILQYIMNKKLDRMTLISGVLVAIFGGVTVFLNDSTFIKLKPTIFSAVMAIILLVGVFMKKNLLKSMMGSVLNLADDGWRILTIRWAIFFIILAVLNEIIWRNFSEDFWVNYKVFGILPLTFIFMMLQVRLINRYLIEDVITDKSNKEADKQEN